MSRRPYTAKQVAALVGLCPARFYALRQKLHAVDQMPAPIAESIGQLRWERSGMDCWLLRHHPFAPKAPANDLLPQPTRAASVEEERAELALVYGKR